MEPTAPKKPSILIVDDEPDILAALALHFLVKGMDILLAHDGAEALELFEQSKPTIVLLDVLMPELDGLFVMREMLELSPDAKIIVASGHLSKEQARTALAEGARDFALKPLDYRSLDAAVDALLLVEQAGP